MHKEEKTIDTLMTRVCMCGIVWGSTLELDGYFSFPSKIISSTQCRLRTLSIEFGKCQAPR